MTRAWSTSILVYPDTRRMSRSVRGRLPEDVGITAGLEPKPGSYAIEFQARLNAIRLVVIYIV
jgi:hypothetical protein